MAFACSVPVLAAGLVAVVCAAAATPAIHIEPPVLSRFEDGPRVPAGSSFVSGDTLYFSCRLTGYQAKETDDIRHVQLHYNIEVRDPFGVPVAEPKAGKISTELSPEDKHWTPKLRDAIVVPAFAPAGVYHIAAQVVDELDNSQTSLETTFEVTGRKVEPNSPLAIRDFHFYRRETEREPLQSPAYGSGDTVWARFDITGFKLGEKNRLDVEYGVTVLRPTGEVLYSRPTAAAEKKESFYPQRWVPGALSLNLTKDLPPARYTLIVTARDGIGGQKCELREMFDVE
jgi:hypothetical protein